MHDDLTPSEARAIAEEAYVVAYPAVRTYQQFWRSTQDPGSTDHRSLDRLTLNPARPGPGSDPFPPVDTALDTHHQPLDGARSGYRLRFAERPPASFWSVTLYDPWGALITNEIDRYHVTSESPHLRQDTDRSVTVWISVDPPERAGLGNWLPAPSGPFVLVLRLYLPSPEALTGSWDPPAVEPVTRAWASPGR
jgi:hypothetical protein